MSPTQALAAFFTSQRNRALRYGGEGREHSGVLYVSPAELRERILVLGHYLTLVCHPGSTRFARPSNETVFHF
jgi:hypothetical protein